MLCNIGLNNNLKYFDSNSLNKNNVKLRLFNFYDNFLCVILFHVETFIEREKERKREREKQ